MGRDEELHGPFPVVLLVLLVLIMRMGIATTTIPVLDFPHVDAVTKVLQRLCVPLREKQKLTKYTSLPLD